MAIITDHHTLAFAFGLLGNIVAFMVYLAPLPTFYRVYKEKSTGGFQSIPYLVALFSAMLWLYYAFLKPNGFMLITINSIGCATETIYIIMYLIYAPRKAKISTMKLLLLLNMVVFGLILTFTIIFAHGSLRIAIVGWICAGFNVCVFAAPLSIIRLVIRTKSVEYMPFTLAFFLTLCAVMWFFYGLLVKDFFIALPNVLGFTFGIAQMILYMIYKDAKKGDVTKIKAEELDPKTYPSEDQVTPMEIDTGPGIQEKYFQPSDLIV
ncbi:bidirectional sugar transporter SWEET14-like [Macadamia integrifolia]|uniref:bidirectional sugar transporter SWEET14-like n=1 Tax=Macadamia integrifolia TaxID=60698 RepID=UPI001C4FD259|nr:bidirectional sugar transporter SWEET14-like [Macadamia integrifolia]